MIRTGHDLLGRRYAEMDSAGDGQQLELFDNGAPDERRALNRDRAERRLERRAGQTEFEFEEEEA